MLQETEAQELIQKFIDLRKKSQDSKSRIDILEFQKHETKCIEKFKYLVTMRTSRYKSFSNYEDLNQEGFEALVKAMKNYDPKLGSFFWWAHKYIDTRISRSANLHTTIRYPLKVAKETAPHKEAVMPLLIENKYCPDKEVEANEELYLIDSAMKKLNDQQRDIVDMFYGLSQDKVSINKICKKTKLSRSSVVKNLNDSLKILKNSIKL